MIGFSLATGIAGLVLFALNHRAKKKTGLPQPHAVFFGAAYVAASALYFLPLLALAGLGNAPEGNQVVATILAALVAACSFAMAAFGLINMLLALTPPVVGILLGISWTPRNRAQPPRTNRLPGRGSKTFGPTLYLLS